MRNALLVLAVLAVFIVASQPASAAHWWNESWHFRVPVNVSFATERGNASVNASVNFTSILNSFNNTGTFDRNSLRVTENDSEIPMDFLNTTIAAGNVSWIVNGTTPANTNRTFHIYFDTVENGAKTAGNVISESCNGSGNNTCYWRSGYPAGGAGVEVFSNQTSSPGLGYQWNRSWAQSIEISWKWSTESGFDSAYLYLNGALARTQSGSGSNSETVLLRGSRVSAAFDNDDATTSGSGYPSTDSYGTYGTAVDTIKFYPTANISTGAFTASHAAAEKQYSPNLTNISVSGAGWGETFNYTVNATDSENDNVSVTLFTYENGVWNRKSTQIGNNTVLNWTITPFSCSDIGQLNYMFEYNDSSHVPVNTSNYSQTVEKDDIVLEYHAGNSSVNREGSDNITFGVKFNDTDRRTYVSGASVNFWAYYSGAWNSLGANDTVSGGIGLYNINPGCSVEANAHQWKVNYTGTCYKTNESDNFVFTTLGQLKNYLIRPSYLSVHDLGNSVPIEANITDECDNTVPGATVNLSVNTTNYTMVDRGSGKYNYSWDSSGMVTGNYTVLINASKLFYVFNLTSWLNWFAVVAGPPQINVTLNATNAAQNTVIQINASITDMSATGLNWVRVNITYPNSTNVQYNITNITPVVWQYAFNDTLLRGQYNFTVFASDNAGKTGNSTNSTKIYARLNVTLSSQDYTKDGLGWVYYRASDANASLGGVNVSLTVQRPDGAELPWETNRNPFTDEFGFLPTPAFIIPMNMPSGAYKLTAVSSFNDTLTGILVNNTSSYNFTVSVASSTSTTAKIVIPTVQYVGHDLSFVALFYNSTGLADPDSMYITVYQLTSQYNSTLWISKTKSNMNKLGTGIYTYSQSIAAGTATGNYLISLNSSISGTPASDISAFEILQGGPFDVEVIPVQAEVSQGGTISFYINITNKGPVDRGDSTVTYWIDDGSRYYATTGVFVPARGNWSDTKSFTIYSDEPVGVKNISVKVDYDPFYGPTNASSTFRVTAAAAAQPSASPSGGGTGGGGGTSAAPATVSAVSANVSSKLQITSYPAEIEIERGWAKFVTITVNNTDGAPLHNVYVSLADIPDEWFEIQMPAVAELSGNKSFLVRFSVPTSVKSGNYKAKLKAISKESSDERDIIVRVFSSKDELIKYQLETVFDKISFLDALLNQTERDGKDVKKLRNNLNDIRFQAKNAESLLNRRLYNDASSTIITINDLLNKLENDINELRKETAEFLPSYWFFLSVIALGATVIISYLYFFRKIKVTEAFTLQKISEMKKLVLGKTTGSGLKADMEKTQKMLKLIQKEYEDGLITKETYEELKKINEERLLSLGKKLSELGIKE